MEEHILTLFTAKPQKCMKNRLNQVNLALGTFLAKYIILNLFYCIHFGLDLNIMMKEFCLLFVWFLFVELMQSRVESHHSIVKIFMKQK